MTSIDNAPLQPEPPIRALQQKGAGGRASPWPRAMAFVGVLACGVALGVGGAAAVAAGMDPMAWRQGARLTFVQRAVARALDSVGASAAQEAKVHDIIVAKFAEIAPNPEEHEGLRKQALDLLAAPTIDRAAVERLRTRRGHDIRREVEGGGRRPARRRRPAHAEVQGLDQRAQAASNRPLINAAIAKANATENPT